MDNLTMTFTVDQTPQQAFDAINDVRAWWSGDIDGRTDALGEEWSYRVPDIHYSKFRTTELVPGQRIGWLVTDSCLTFIEDKEEWTGTTVRFDISAEDGRTRVRFTHAGLEPEHECFNVCSNAWAMYVTGSLRRLIETGSGEPNSLEGAEAIEAVRGADAR
jgi:hypothetical protein